MYTRRNQRLAVLDTHILAYMHELGYDVPRATPQSPKRYKAIEEQFLKLCDEKGIAPHEFDNFIWQTRTKSYKK